MSVTFVVLFFGCFVAFVSAAPQTFETGARIPELCLLPPIEENVEPCGDFSLRYYYDVRTKDCEAIAYSGCGGSQNLFFSEEDCEIQCDFDETSGLFDD